MHNKLRPQVPGRCCQTPPGHPDKAAEALTVGRCEEDRPDSTPTMVCAPKRMR